ncbi:MAG: phosphoethanolamine transferase [Aeromonadaceae bacterium]
MKLRFSLGAIPLSLLAALFFVVAGNQQFWSHTLDFFSPLNGQNLLMLLSLFSVTLSLMLFLLSLIALPWLFRPLLTLLLLCNASAAYFMNSYGILIDRDMLQNVFETNPAEALELLNLKLCAYLLGLGVLPSLLLWRTSIRYGSWKSLLWRKLGIMALALAVIAGNAWFFYQDYASFFRNKGEIRRLFTPANFIYGTGDYIHRHWFLKPTKLERVGLDARVVARGEAAGKPTLFVIVVGETARAANFGLDGYGRQTTPQLAKLDVINFPQTSSCGTATATSVPCMFSPMSREEYKSSQHMESLLDVVQRAGIPVLWKDNNSGCKGTCDRVPHEDLSQAKDARWCRDGECFDDIMLEGLAPQLANHKGDLLLVLHQKGSHGPAYFQRYPKQFEQFTPVCQTNKLQECSREAITNAYDNTILYTDHVLAKLITLLKQQSHYNTAMWYMSDHGESLGENNLYLHGAPYSMSPETQRHIPMLQWISEGFAAQRGLDLTCLRQQASQPASHDNLFHSVLGILDIHTSVYQPKLDLFKACRKR